MQELLDSTRLIYGNLNTCRMTLWLLTAQVTFWKMHKLLWEGATGGAARARHTSTHLHVYTHQVTAANSRR